MPSLFPSRLFSEPTSVITLLPNCHMLPLRYFPVYFSIYGGEYALQIAPCDWFILGFAGGCLSICRWQDGVFLAGPLLFDVMGRELWTNPWSWLRSRLFYAFAVGLCWVPQLVEWKIIYGNYLTNPFQANYSTFPPPFVWQVLMSQPEWLVSMDALDRARSPRACLRRFSVLSRIRAVGRRCGCGNHSRRFPELLAWYGFVQLPVI